MLPSFEVQVSVPYTYILYIYIYVSIYGFVSRCRPKVDGAGNTFASVAGYGDEGCQAKAFKHLCSRKQALNPKPCIALKSRKMKDPTYLSPYNKWKRPWNMTWKPGGM